MPATILSAFKKFPGESAIIGRLLAGYSTLELDLMNCVQMGTGNFDTALKRLFRVRGETKRVNTGERLGKEDYRKYRLGTAFGEAIGAMRYCLRVRNQYAHCVWWDDLSGKLAFANLEDAASISATVRDLSNLPTLYVDVELLNLQEGYFVYVDHLFRWINFERRKRAGALPKNPHSKPSRMTQPPLHIQ